MKNLSLVLNIILLLAVAYLFADRFSSPKAATPESHSMPATTSGGQRIVYINIDSLQSKSTSYQATKNELEKNFQQVRASLVAKNKAFQKDVADYQQKASSGLLTPNQAKNIEEKLAKQQQEIAALQDSASADLDRQTNEFDQKFTADIKGFSDSIRVANGYDFVLLYGGVISPMLSADSTYDITQSVVDLLNKKHKQ